MFQFGIGEAAGLATACAWSVSCLLHTEASRQLGPTSMLILRLPLAVACLLLIALATGEVHAYPLRAVAIMMLSGIAGIAVCDWCFYMAIQRIGVRAALVCQSLYACFAAMLGVVFLGEQLGIQGVLGIMVATGGVIMVITAERHGQNSLTMDPKSRRSGILLAFCSACSLALGMVLSKQSIILGLTPISGGLIRTFTALVSIWLVNALTHKIKQAFIDLKYHPKTVWLLLGGCVFGTVGGLWLSLTALSNTATGIATVLMSMQVVILPFLTWILEHKRPALGTLAGAVIACCGAALVLLRP